MSPYQLCNTPVLLFSTYWQVNPIMFPASGAGNVREPRLLPQVGGRRGGARSRVRIDRCVYTIGEVELPLSTCLRSSLNHVNEVEGQQCLWDWGWRLSCKITGPCWSNPAPPGSLSTGSKLTAALSSSSLCTDEVKNKWNYTSIPHMLLRHIS